MNIIESMKSWIRREPAGIVPAPAVRAVVPKNDNDALRHLVRIKALHAALKEAPELNRAASLLAGIKMRTALLSVYGIEVKGPNDVQVLIDRIMKGPK